jgi:hypothetical protein
MSFPAVVIDSRREEGIELLPEKGSEQSGAEERENMRFLEEERKMTKMKHHHPYKRLHRHKIIMSCEICLICSCIQHDSSFLPVSKIDRSLYETDPQSFFSMPLISMQR